MFSKSAWTCSVLLATAFPAAAQHALSPGAYLGLEVGKPLANLSVMVEPTLRWRPGEPPVALLLSGGFSTLQRDSVLRNLDYHNRGYFLKPGVEVLLFDILSISASFLYSRYREYGDFEIKGRYYASHHTPYRQDFRSTGLEGAVNVLIPLHSRWLLVGSGRGSLLSDRSLNTNVKDVPLKYTPGAGYRFNNAYITGGISLQVVFRLSKPAAVE